MADTPWTGLQAFKFYLQSGQYTSTLKTSQAGNSTLPSGIDYDGTNTPNCDFDTDKLYLNSGQFTSTVKSSVAATDNVSTGVCYDGTNSPWVGQTNDRLRLQSGQFSGTIKTSLSIVSIEPTSQGTSVDTTPNTFLCGTAFDRLQLLSGQFTSTMKDSELINGIDNGIGGISWDGTNTLWTGSQADKLYLQSSNFTSTLKTSQSINSIDVSPFDISSNETSGRIAGTYTATCAATIPAATAAATGREFGLNFGQSSATIPAVQASSAATFVKYAPHPFKRRASVRSAFSRRRTVTGRDLAREKSPICKNKQCLPKQWEKEPRMAQTIELMTFADVIDHLIDYQRANPSAEHTRHAKRAIFQAYDNFKNDHQWLYYYDMGRICTNAPYDTGTVAYDHTGGGVERQLTLTDGVWPEWAAFGHVIIGAVIYEVAERISNTVISLDINLGPDGDIAAGTPYILMRHTYSLPADFVNIEELYSPENWHSIRAVHPREWMVAHRYNITSSNTPEVYSIIGSPDFMGSMSIVFYPFPDTEAPIDFLYQRRPRPLRIERVQGTLNGTLGDMDAVYVDGDVFHEEQMGSIIRVTDSDGREFPTGREGLNPYSEERTVMEVTDDQDQLEVDQQWLKQHSNSKFVISDPVDLEPGIMRPLFLKRCEMELAILTRMSDKNEIVKDYYSHLERHRTFGARIREHRSVYSEMARGGRRLAYMPSGPDVD